MTVFCQILRFLYKTKRSNSEMEFFVIKDVVSGVKDRQRSVVIIIYLRSFLIWHLCELKPF